MVQLFAVSVPSLIEVEERPNAKPFRDRLLATLDMDINNSLVPLGIVLTDDSVLSLVVTISWIAVHAEMNLIFCMVMVHT